jgi:hypothetical protein
MYKNKTERGAKNEIIKILLNYSPDYISTKELAEELRFMNSAAVARRLKVWLAEPYSFLEGFVIEARPQANNRSLKEYRLVCVSSQSCKTENCLEKKL